MLLKFARNEGQKTSRYKRRETLSRQVFDVAALELDDIFASACKLIDGVISVSNLNPRTDNEILLRVETLDRGNRILRLKVSEFL